MDRGRRRQHALNGASRTLTSVLALRLSRLPARALLCGVLLLLLLLALLQSGFGGTARGGASSGDALVQPAAPPAGTAAHLRTREHLLRRNATRLVFVTQSQARRRVGQRAARRSPPAHLRGRVRRPPTDCFARWCAPLAS